MTTLRQFINRLDKIGVKVELISNVPWVYLDKVNGKKVKGKFEGNHGFTCFWIPVSIHRPERISDIKLIFDKIRETLKQ